MKKYIPLDDLVAEIKRRISLFKKEKKVEKWSAEASQMNVVSLGARIAMLEEVLSFLDTLEVKDVDLEEDIHDIYKCDVSTLKTEKQYAKVAKHFFELGMTVSNKVQKGE